MDVSVPEPPSRPSSLRTHTLTVDKLLLLRGDDAGQVRVQVAAAPLRLQPRLSVGEVQVAVPLKLSPAFFTLLLVCSRNEHTGDIVQRLALASLPPRLCDEDELSILSCLALVLVEERLAHQSSVAGKLAADLFSSQQNGNLIYLNFPAHPVFISGSFCINDTRE